MCKFYDHERYVTIYHYDEKDKYFTHHEENCYQPAGIGLPANSTDIPVPDGELPSGFIYVFENEQWTAKKDVFKKIELAICRKKTIFIKKIYHHISQ
ncbi:hypothetical protein [Gilliamella sp. BG6]|uniref:hypothetical protein n=1 Tax=unclassified Gilliamella TaxID=2685620 RepID=UPI0039859A42